MRLIVFISMNTIWLPTTANADAAAFNQQLFRFLQTNASRMQGAVKRGTPSVGVKFSIDRDGKMLSAEVDQGSGSAEHDAEVLAAVRRMPPFPRVPDDL